MATFATNTDVETRFKGGAAELEALTESTPYNAAKVDAAREKSYGFIRSLIGQRYQIPADLSGYPELAALLREMELDLVEFELWSTTRESIPERVKDKRRQTWDLLMAVANGKAALPVPAELPATEAAGTQAEVVGPERVMTRDGLDGVF